MCHNERSELAGRRRRGWLATGTVLGLTAIVAGCGGSSKLATPATQPATSGSAVLAAYTQTLNGKSADVSLNETLTEAAAGKSTQHVNVSGTGSIDFTDQNAQISYLSQPAGTFAMRFINPVLYIQLPAAERSQLSHGASWAEINLNSVAEAKLGASLAQLSSSSQQSTQTLSYLQGVSSTGITTVGPATIRGVATTEYKATIDLTKQADRQSAATQAALKALYSEVHASTEPVQVWLDAQGRVRQISYQLHESTSPSSTSSAGTTTPASSEQIAVTLDYFNFGVPVQVTAPPSNQVENITSQAVTAATSTTA